jgi:hypothetical protein
MCLPAWPALLVEIAFLRRMWSPLGVCLLLSAAFVEGAVAQNPPPTPNGPTAAEPPDKETAKRFEEFTKRLSGSTMQGHFSIDGRESELKQDSYEIKSVSKLPTGDLWLFTVRIRYGDHDVNAPLPITVSWADKTPVIVVDKLTIPGLGTFDARVVIADERYAGTWQHGDVGGHLFGKIVPAGATAEPQPTEPAAQPDPEDKPAD